VLVPSLKFWYPGDASGNIAGAQHGRYKLSLPAAPKEPGDGRPAPCCRQLHRLLEHTDYKLDWEHFRAAYGLDASSDRLQVAE